jgi:hypothetical protein
MFCFALVVAIANIYFYEINSDSNKSPDRRRRRRNKKKKGPAK